MNVFITREMEYKQKILPHFILEAPWLIRGKDHIIPVPS
jgi:hypothetical protein